MEPMQYCTLYTNPNVQSMSKCPYLLYLPERNVAFRHITPKSGMFGGGAKPPRIEASVREIFDTKKILAELDGPYEGCSEPKQMQIPTALAERINKIATEELAVMETKKNFDPEVVRAAMMNLMSQAPVEDLNEEETKKLWEANLPKAFVDSMAEKEKLEKFKKQVGAEFTAFAYQNGLKL